MKRCPKCNIEYYDATLEFCLEDGTRLLMTSAYDVETLTVIQNNKTNATGEKTVNLPSAALPDTMEFGSINRIQTAPQTTPESTLIKETVAQQSNRILEIAPFVIALAHNWWQWIYLNNQYYSSFSSYVLSANFLMWMLLLIAGAAIGLFAVKRCQNKAFAFAGLVILSINLILCLVPKR